MTTSTPAQALKNAFIVKMKSLGYKYWVGFDHNDNVTQQRIYVDLTPAQYELEINTLRAAKKAAGEEMGVWPNSKIGWIDLNSEKPVFHSTREGVSDEDFRASVKAMIKK